MYNVLEKLPAGDKIESKDRENYNQGLVGILKDIHDGIDAEVAAAYGWPVDLSDDDILHRLVDLDRARATEEAKGKTAERGLEHVATTGKAAWPKASPTRWPPCGGACKSLARPARPIVQANTRGRARRQSNRCLRR